MGPSYQDEEDWQIRMRSLPAPEAKKLREDLARLRREGNLTRAKAEEAERKHRKAAKRRKDMEQLQQGSPEGSAGRSFWQRLWG